MSDKKESFFRRLFARAQKGIEIPCPSCPQDGVRGAFLFPPEFGDKCDRCGACISEGLAEGGFRMALATWESKRLHGTKVYDPNPYEDENGEMVTGRLITRPFTWADARDFVIEQESGGVEMEDGADLASVKHVEGILTERQRLVWDADKDIAGRIGVYLQRIEDGEEQPDGGVDAELEYDVWLKAIEDGKDDRAAEIREELDKLGTDRIELLASDDQKAVLLGKRIGKMFKDGDHVAVPGVMEGELKFLEGTIANLEMRKDAGEVLQLPEGEDE